MKFTTNKFLLVVGIAHLGILIYAARNNFSSTLLFFCLWAILPWVFSAFINFWLSNPKTKMIWFSLNLVLSLLSIYGFVDSLFLAKGSTASLGIIFIPLWTGIILVIAAPFALWNRKAKILEENKNVKD